MATQSESEAPRWRTLAPLNTLHARAALLGQIRGFFSAKQVLEVQTPLLGQATVTDPAIESFAVSAGETGRLQGFLQTSTEYHQKRLLAAGVGDNYTLGPVWRVGEQGRLHNPEFTMLEWYRLGFDDRTLMTEVAELVNLVLGDAPYHTHTYAQLHASVTLEPEERAAFSRADQDDLRVSRALERLGKGRHFVVDYPADNAVLARLDPDNPEISRRFELVIDGIELANGYFELTDPTVHRQRFAQDNHRRTDNRQSRVEPDAGLLDAVTAGLPDCAGVALGVDRLLMLSLGARSIAEVLTFDWERR